MSKKEVNVCFYDIENGLIKAHLFSPGKQVVRSSQLIKGFMLNPLICLSYAINKGKIHTISGSSTQIIEAFDKVVDKCDIVIGKNNLAFDNKWVNTHRWLGQLPANLSFLAKSDDLQTQFRKHFRLPSQGLDYISTLRGLDGKVHMDFSDWVDIAQYQAALKYLNHAELSTLSAEQQYVAVDLYCMTEYEQSFKIIRDKGIKAQAKMEFYNRKDVADTRTLWYDAAKYLTPKHNQALMLGRPNACQQCGATHIQSRGYQYSKTAKYQIFVCMKCGGRAGRIELNSIN